MFTKIFLLKSPNIPLCQLSIFFSVLLIGDREDRVLGFFSSRLNWAPPTPSPAGKCVTRAPPPSLSPGEGHTRLRERGWGVPIRTSEETDTVVFKVYMYLVIVPAF